MSTTNTTHAPIAKLFDNENHVLQVNQQIAFQNNVFPYPPFQYYKWKCISGQDLSENPEDVEITEQYGPHDGLDGSGRTRTHYFKFTKPGKFKIIVNSSTNQDEWSFLVEVSETPSTTSTTTD